MFTKLRSRPLAALQAVVLLGVAVLLVGPVQLPDPLGVGFQLSWALVCSAAAAVICVVDATTANVPRTRLDFWVLAYLAAAALSALFAVDRWVTLEACVTVAAEVGLLYSAASIARRQPRAADALLLVIIAGACLVQFIAFAYHLEVGLDARPKEYPLVQGWAGYPELGALAVLPFGLLIALVQTARDRVAVWVAASLLFLLSIAIVFLYSRTAWVACGVVVFGAIALQRRRLGRMLIVVGAVTLLAAFAALAGPTIRFLATNLVTGSTTRTTAGPHIDIASPGTRIALWRKTIDMIADSPLHGVGLGNFRAVFETEYNPELNNDQRRGAHAHNLWLQRTAELGIPGGLIYLGLWVVVLSVAYRAARLEPRFRTLGVFLAVAGTAASEFTDNVPYMVAGLRVYLLTWVLFGLAAGLLGAGKTRQSLGK